MPSVQQAASAGDGRRRCVACSTVLAADNTARVCGRCLREQRDQLRTPPQLGSDFWTTDDLLAAFESQHMGRVLKAYRHHPQHLQMYGKALNQETLGRWLNLTQAQISKLENGKPEQNLQTLRVYAQALYMPPNLLWFDLAGQTRVSVQLATSEIPVSPTAVHIARNFDPLAALQAASREDPVLELRRLAEARVHFERMYRNAGGLVTGPRIESFLARHALPLMAGFGSARPSDAERASRRAVGSLIALAGVCAYDAEDWHSASSHFSRALAVAERFRDPGLHAYVLALMANQALALEDFAAAEHLATFGLRSCPQVEAEPLTVDLTMVRAKALAAIGDRAAAAPLLRQLEQAIDQLTPSAGIAEASYAQAGHLKTGLAEALTSLGDISAARSHMEHAMRSGGHPRGAVNQLASLATLEVVGGDVERASLLACEMIDKAQGMESRRLRTRFAKLRADLARQPSTSSREALDKLDVALTLMTP